MLPSSYLSSSFKSSWLDKKTEFMLQSALCSCKGGSIVPSCVSVWHDSSHVQELELLQLWHDKVTPQPPNFAAAQVCMTLTWIPALLCNAMHAVELTAVPSHSDTQPLSSLPYLFTSVHDFCRCPPEKWTDA